MKNKILIFSGCEYSLKNKGDHSMLLGLVEMLKQIDQEFYLIAYAMKSGALKDIPYITEKPSPELSIIKRSDRANTTFNRIRIIWKGIVFLMSYLIFSFTGTRFFWRDSPALGFFNHLQNARALVFSGGGYLNSIWWCDGLYSKTFAAIAAKVSGIPVILTSQGLGPFSHPLDKLMAKLLFHVSRIIGTRDENSINTVRLIHKNKKSKIILTWDDAIRVPCKKIGGYKFDIPENTEYITVNFRNSSSYNKEYTYYADLYAKILDEILEKTNLIAVFIPISFHSEDSDVHSSETIVEAMKQKNRALIIRDEVSPQMLKWIISRSRLSIGVSYHFLLFSLSQNVPAIGIHSDLYYQTKHDGLFRLYQIHELSLSLSINKVQRIAHKAISLLSSPNQVQSKLYKVNSELKLHLTEAEKEFSRILKNAN